MDDDRSEFSDLINSDFFTELEIEDYNYISPFRRIYRIKTMISIMDTYVDEGLEKLRDEHEKIDATL